MKFYNTHAHAHATQSANWNLRKCRFDFPRVNYLEDQPCDRDRENEHYHERLATETTVFVMSPMSNARKARVHLYSRREIFLCVNDFILFYIILFLFFLRAILFNVFTLTSRKYACIIESTCPQGWHQRNISDKFAWNIGYHHPSC